MLQVRDTKVHEKATVFLMKIYKSLNKEVMEKKIAEVKMDLLAVCMGNIRKGQQSLTESSSSLMRSANELEYTYSLHQVMTESDH